METQIMGTIGVNYLPAIQSAKQFAESLKTVNTQMYNTQQIAKMLGVTFAKDLTGGVQQAKIIYDQYGNALKTVEMQIKQTEQAIRNQGRTVKQEAEQQSVLASQLQHRFGWFISGAMFYGSMTIAKNIVDTASQVEYGMTRIRKVMSDQTADFTKLRDELLELGVTYGRTSQDVLEAATIWAQAGYKSTEIADLTKTSLLAMNVAELSANESVRLLIATMKQFNMTASESQRIIDAVNETSNNYAVEAKDLMEAIAVSGQVAKNAGIELEQLVGYTTALSEATGRSGKEIGNAIRSIIAFSQRPTAINVFRDIGVDIVDTAGNFKQFDKVFTELSNAWNNVTEDQIATFNELGKELGLVTEGIGNLTDVEKTQVAQAGANLFRRNYFISLMEHMGTATEATATAYNSLNSAEEENAMLLESHTAKVRQMKAAFEELAVSIGDAGLLDTLKGVADGTKGIVNAFNDLPPVLKGATTALGAYVTMLTGANLISQTFYGVSLAKGIEITTLRLREAATALRTAGSLSAFAAGWPILVPIIAAATGALGSYISTRKHAIEMEEKNAQRTEYLIKQYHEQKNALDATRGNTEQFIKANENLLATMKEIGEISPRLVSAWDEHGNAIAIATERYSGLAKQANLTKQELEDIQRLTLFADIDKAQHNLNEAQIAYTKAIAKRNQYLRDGGLTLLDGSHPYLDRQHEEAKGLFEAAKRELELAKAREEAFSAASEKEPTFDPFAPDNLSGGKSPYQQALAQFEYMVAMDMLTIEQQISQLKQFYHEYSLTLEERQNLDIRIHKLTKQLETEQTKLREDNLKKLADEQRKHYEDAFRSAMDYYNHQNALARMSKDEQIRYLKELSQVYEWETSKQWDIQERLFRLYQDEMKKQQDNIESAYKRRVELIDAEADRRISRLQDQIDALDDDQQEDQRLRAKEDFEKRIADLQEQYRYHDLRTGKEHEQAKIDIERQIAEENRRWQQQLTDWERDDKKQSLQKQIKDIKEQAEAEKKVWEQKYNDIKRQWDEWSESFISAAINDPKWLETGQSIGEQIAEGFSRGLSGLDRALDNATKWAGEAKDSIPSPSMPSKPSGITPSARTVLNEILYLKDQWTRGDSEGNAGLKHWAANEAQKYYAQLPDDLAMKAQGMNNEQLRKYLDQAHTGAYVLQSGAAELLKGERVLSPQLTLAFDRLATALTRNPQAAIERGNQFNAPLFNAEKVYFEDVTDMEIFSRELSREIKRI